MDKKTVFISLPMAGLPDELIRKDIEKAKKAFLALTNLNKEDVIFIDTMDNPDPPKEVDDEQKGVWYLGHSLTKLSTCDYAFFWIGWKHARGCHIEHETCDLYRIPHIDVTVDNITADAMEVF